MSGKFLPGMRAILKESNEEVEIVSVIPRGYWVSYIDSGLSFFIEEEGLTSVEPRAKDSKGACECGAWTTKNSNCHQFYCPAYREWK